jgi:hypothetical protein
VFTGSTGSSRPAGCIDPGSSFRPVRPAPVRPAGSSSRRLAAPAAVAALALGLGAAACSSGESSPAASPGTPLAVSAPTSTPPPPQQLPMGGREIFPKYRVVAYYGAAHDGAMGVLGATGPDAMADKLALQAAAYAPYGKPVLTCFELITTVANATAGSDRMYSSRGKPDMVAEYLAAARRHKSLLLLDLQPGRADFLDQLKTYEQFLKEPEVGVALDAEWRTPDSTPGKTLGHTSAAEINAVGDYLAGITKRYNLPQKLLVLHQFRTSMIPDRDKVKDWPGLAEALQMDGTGIGPTGNNDKLKVYSILVPENTRFYPGFKVFYKQDYKPMSPAQVMRLKPQPVFISYQ